MSNNVCPKCGSSDISMLIYEDDNLPNFENQKIKKLSKIPEPRPRWECDDCSNRWVYVYNSEIDSFDYDQGYNLDEVYDQ